jgi:hypothetical protein
MSFYSSLLRAVLGAALGVCVAACASGPEVCRRDVITGTQRCETTGGGDYGEAAVTAGAATGAWVAVGCTVNGCELPYRCNEKTKQCEPLQCTSNSDCAGYGCDQSSGRCR